MAHSPAGEDRHGDDVASLTWVQAAARLGIRSVPHVGWLVSSGDLSAVQGRPFLVDAASVEALRRDRDEWISAPKAAEILGCGRSGVWTAVAAGHLTRRRRGQRPSLSRSSVVAYRTRLDAQAEERALRERERRARVEPPATGHVWVTPAVVALMTDCGAVRVRQLLAAGRIPALKVGTRWWIRRDHAEQWAAARAMTRAQVNSAPAEVAADESDPVETA